MRAVWPRVFRRFPQRGGRWQLVSLFFLISFLLEANVRLAGTGPSDVVFR